MRLWHSIFDNFGCRYGNLATLCCKHIDLANRSYLTEKSHTVESNKQTLSYQVVLAWRHWQCPHTAVQVFCRAFSTIVCTCKAGCWGLRVQNIAGVWWRLAAVSMSACLVTGVKAVFTSCLFRQCEKCGRAQYKVTRCCCPQRQVVDYARATCFFGRPALSGCQLAQATASLSQRNILCKQFQG